MNFGASPLEDVQGIVDIPLIQGNTKKVTMFFTDQYDVPMILADYVITMDIKLTPTIHEDAIYRKTIGNGLEIITSTQPSGSVANGLVISFGQETFDLDMRLLYYDIAFEKDGELHTLILGKITITDVVTQPEMS